MTIDEAIKHAKEQTEIFGGNHKEFLENVVVWLEELKKLREGRKEIPIATITFNKKDLQKMVDEKVKDIELDIQGIRNQAIDDFVDKVEFVVGSEDRDIYCKETVKEVAEQLKEGAVDG